MSDCKATTVIGESSLLSAEERNWCILNLKRAPIGKIFPVVVTAALTLCIVSGCSPKQEQPDTVPTASPVLPQTTFPSVETPLPDNSPPNSQDKVPAATPEMFSLSSKDTALFIGALSQDAPYSSGSGITFPYVGIYGEYEDGGNLVAICYVSYQRFDADVATKSLVSAGTSTTYGRAILAVSEDGTYTCKEFSLVGEGAQMEKDLRLFCGTQLSDLPDQIISGNPEYTSTFPSPADMQEEYCEATGYTIR